jgi:hypothetical protein
MVTMHLRLVVALSLVLDVSGALHVYGIRDAAGSTRENIMATILTIIAGLWLFAKTPLCPDQATGDTWWLALLVPLTYMLSISDIFSFIDAGWSPTRAVAFCGGTITLLVLVWRRAPAQMMCALAFVLGVGLRALHITYVPLEPSRGDMLPLVQQALGNLVVGNSPYATYSMPWELPLTDLPLTWLAYGPAFVAGLDMRWTNIVAEVAILGAALWMARRLSPHDVGVDVPVLVWSWLFLSPTMIRWDMSTTAPIGWAALAWALALIVSRQSWTSVVLGCAAATTPFVAVFAPLIAASWWREDGLWVMLRRGMVAGIVASLMVLPWFVWSPSAFLDGTYRWFNDLSRFPGEKWSAEQTWVQLSGWSGELWMRGEQRWLKPIQVALVLAVTGLYAYRGARRTALLAHATGAYLLFMLFNPVLWPYLYTPALIVAMLSTIVPASRNPRPSHLQLHARYPYGGGDLV